MKEKIKSCLKAAMLVLAVVALGTVIGGDVIVKEGTIEGEVFKSTGCTASGTKSIALGGATSAEGDYSTAMGYNTQAIGQCSTAMGSDTIAFGEWSTATGYGTTADGYWSTAMGYGTAAVGDYSTAMGCETEATDSYSTSMGYDTTASGWMSMAAGCGTTASGLVSTSMGYHTIAGSANYTFALGKNFTNNVQNSFAVGFGQKDFSVVSGLVTAHGNLYTNGWISGQDLIDRSSFYDKDKYGRALEHLQDSSTTVKVNAQGERAYNHEADPEFILRWITIPDYDKYTEQQVWDDELNCMVITRNYQTHKEVGSSFSAKIAWLTQCVYELKQENEHLKAELAVIKAKLGME
jgi:hypothetical protein